MLLVNVKVALPAERPVTTPALVTEAAALLLTQVPPVVGDKVVVAPTHIDVLPVMLTTGLALIVTAPVVAEQFGAVLLVNVKVALPVERPVTIPALVTEAAALLLNQVPPVVGDRVVVAPTHIDVLPVMLTVGNANILTVLFAVVEQPDPFVTVYVMFAAPALRPVTRPDALTLASKGVVVPQTPPAVAFVNCCVPFTHILSVPPGNVPATVGNAFTIKLTLPDVPPPGVGLKTVIGNVPDVAMLPAVIEAVNWVELTKVVVLSTPLNRTMEPLIKLVPFTVKVKATSPAHLADGEIVEPVGTGLFTVKELLVPVCAPPEVLVAVIVADNIPGEIVTL